MSPHASLPVSALLPAQSDLRDRWVAQEALVPFGDENADSSGISSKQVEGVFHSNEA